MKNILKKITLLVAVATCGTACAPAQVDATWGDSVRNNLEAQVYDPRTITNPTRVPADGTDGKRMEAVMDEHRGHTGSAESVSNPIVINVGQ